MDIETNIEIDIATHIDVVVSVDIHINIDIIGRTQFAKGGGVAVRGGLVKLPYLTASRKSVCAGRWPAGRRLTGRPPGWPGRRPPAGFFSSCCC